MLLHNIFYVHVLENQCLHWSYVGNWTNTCSITLAFFILFVKGNDLVWHLYYQYEHLNWQYSKVCSLSYIAFEEQYSLLLRILSQYVSNRVFRNVKLLFAHSPHGTSLNLCHCKTVKIKSWPWTKMRNCFSLETATETVKWRTYFVPRIGEHWARINFM